MGKISDALDKIDSLEEIGIDDPQDDRGQFEESIPLKEPSEIVIEKDPNDVAVNGKWDNRLFKAVNDSLVMVDVFKTLRSIILHPPDGREIPQSIMVTSSIAQEGKSFIAANLGISIASGMDQPCLLVDCNLRNPNLALAFGINQKYGLVNYLRDEVDLAGVSVKTSVQKLSILPSGIVKNKDEELLSATRVHTLIEEISKMYKDYTIIVDSASMLMAPESSVIARQVDAIIMVVRQGWAKKAEVKRFTDAVDNTKMLGIVFNDLSFENGNTL